MKVTAILGHQRGRKILTGVLTAEELFQIYEIDIWEAGKPIETQGCQRPPIKSHYRKIGRKLRDDSKSTLPTSITFSANTHEKELQDGNSIKISKTNINKVVYVTIPDSSKLKVIDGQHRIRGIEYAIRDLKMDEMTRDDLRKFEFPFVIMLVEGRVDEIRCFYEINSTPKKVPTDLALQLLNEMNKNSNVDLSKTERWKLVALNAAMYLRNNPDSVWYKNISEGKADGEIATSTSFVTSLKPVLEISFIKSIWTSNSSEKEAGEKIAELVNNYWNALAELMPKSFPDTFKDKTKWTIQKTPGFYTLHKVAPFIIEECMRKRDKTTTFSKENIKSFIANYGGYGLNSAYELVWIANDKENNIKGGDASMSNSQKAFSMLAQRIIDDIDENYLEQDHCSITF